ncbi:MAG TPA: GNAT family N-acetyltransferase [Verrucomicrobiae bacterium]|nr:GNAT family N-acetyltransferase [Verrucomicrobiae bacterium]
MKIRTALAYDIAVIADYNIKLALESEGLTLDPPTVNAGVAALLRDSSKGIYFVAEAAGGTVAGQLLITYEWSDWRNANIWWIQSVYVAPEFRGSGVFQALFQHVEKIARDSGEVWSLRLYMEKQNERARRAYQKMGMKEMSYEVLEYCIRKPGGGD